MPYKKACSLKEHFLKKKGNLFKNPLTLIPSIIKEAVIKLASAPAPAPARMQC